MPRSPGVVQFQCVMSPELRNTLDAAAVALRSPGSESANLDRGEMSRRLFRWFLTLPRQDQLQILSEGVQLEDSAVASRYGDATEAKTRVTNAGTRIVKVKPDRKRADKLD